MTTLRSVIGQKQERLLGHALARVFRTCKDAKPETTPVYYVATGADDTETLGHGVRALHEMDQLPWPAPQCIVAVEPPRSLWPERTGLSLVVISLLIDYRAHPSLHTQPHPIYGLHILAMEQGTLISSGAKLWREPVDRWMALWAGKDQWHPAPSGPRCWVGDSWSDTPWDRTRPPAASLLWASALLACLVPLTYPCHYIATGTMKRGIGHKHERARTVGKKLIAYVPYDRLYTEWHRTSVGDAQVAPHFRRGHIRNLWKQAGIDRHGLPDDPGTRLRCALENRVRRIYVHPTWVGERTGESEQFRWQIQTGETELPQLAG